MALLYKEYNRIYIRPFLVRDINKRYIEWLNNNKVNKFLSIRGHKQTLKTVTVYVRSFQKQRSRYFFGIFLKENDLHIGNITLSHIDCKNKYAIVGICIGDTQYWGKGIGGEALECTKKIVFDSLKLNRLEAGVSSLNNTSLKLFKKSGFQVEGVLRERERINGKFCDGIILGITKRMYRKY
ncbi:MAG: GNAT family protein [bacterium]